LIIFNDKTNKSSACRFVSNGLTASDAINTAKYLFVASSFSGDLFETA